MNWGRKLITGIAGLGLLCGLTACSIDSDALDELASRLMGEMLSEESGEQNAADSRTPDGETLREEVFGSVPYFRDDAGQNTQLRDGWLYGYWSRKLCRINMETMEEEVLFETAYPQDGIFCIEGDWIYFLVRSGAGIVEEAKASVYQMKRDGSGLKEIAGGIDPWMGKGYQLDCYENILYLTCTGADNSKNRYFKIDGNGVSAEIEESETLYGMLPEGLLPCEKECWFTDLPRMPYCMRHFGYVFATDKENRLYRVGVASGEYEEVMSSEGTMTESTFLTNDSLVYRDNRFMWYRCSLDDLTETTALGYLDCYNISFYDDRGLYFAEREDDGIQIRMLPWSEDGEAVNRRIRAHRLSASLYGDNLDLLYSDGEYLYYDALKSGDGVVMRVSMENQEPATQMAYYYENPLKDICARETDKVTFVLEETGAQCVFEITRVCMTEDTPAAKKINAALWGAEFDLDDWLESDRQMVRESSFYEEDEIWNTWDSDILRESRISSGVNYLDEKYIGISVFCYEYNYGAIHGMYGTDNYLFERATGERVKITDLVADSKEKIGDIMLPYIQEKCLWELGEAELREMIFQEDRLFLTAEGPGLHFDVYELASYADGSVDIVVPWELFSGK